MSQAVAFVLAYLTYPACLGQMFRGQRGAQATENFFDLSNTFPESSPARSSSRQAAPNAIQRVSLHQNFFSGKVYFAAADSVEKITEERIEEAKALVVYVADGAGAEAQIGRGSGGRLKLLLEGKVKLPPIELYDLMDFEKEGPVVRLPEPPLFCQEKYESV